MEYKKRVERPAFCLPRNEECIPALSARAVLGLASSCGVSATAFLGGGMRLFRILLRVTTAAGSPPQRPAPMGAPERPMPREMRFPVRPDEPASPRPVISGYCHVIDGDTIVIDGRHIRIAGIDAPELDHPWGRKSKWAMVALCKGQRITARLKPELSYDRLVAECFLPDGRDLAAELVQAGAGAGLAEIFRRQVSFARNARCAQKALARQHQAERGHVARRRGGAACRIIAACSGEGLPATAPLAGEPGDTTALANSARRPLARLVCRARPAVAGGQLFDDHWPPGWSILPCHPATTGAGLPTDGDAGSRGQRAERASPSIVCIRHYRATERGHPHYSPGRLGIMDRHCPGRRTDGVGLSRLSAKHRGIESSRSRLAGMLGSGRAARFRLCRTAQAASLVQLGAMAVP